MLIDFAHENEQGLQGSGAGGVGIFGCLADNLHGQTGTLEVGGNGIGELIGESDTFAPGGLIAKDHANGKLGVHLVCRLVACHLVLGGIEIGLEALGFSQITPAQADSGCQWLFQITFWPLRGSKR